MCYPTGRKQLLVALIEILLYLPILFFFTFLAQLPLEFKDFIVRNANADWVVVENSLGLQSAKRDKISYTL